ncbi:hypothetical protein PPTG_01121 [Phytophthora nicotianae INRA-310]|uniref:No apical meristem-associated C-terminal domain-containing protein n=2 Tax=Phytophthora nicotianae TaxID=4792 RepID=W2RK18_PHYN3|nr:hypothetical protein PPTG_01121 [Phytophthora nicotianae INRA-310]ETN24960.1 hypothetical protein PPTG_01121 [Phytophthora nicotianae INRA-310]
MPNAEPWTPAEDVALCKAYTNISEDGATSTDQRSSLFWDRIHDTYTGLVPAGTPARKAGALQSRWSGLIRPDVSLFASCLAVVKAEEHSGWTDMEHIDEALLRFTAKREQLNANATHEYEEELRAGATKGKRKPRVRPELFRLHHCYEVLRQSVRFMRDVPRPRKRPRLPVTHQLNNDDGSDNSESDGRASSVEIGNASGTEGSQSTASSAQLLRPASAGKKKAKQLELEGQVDKAIMHSQRELANATSAQVSIMKEQLEVAKQKVELMANQQQALRDQAEMSIMCTSTEGLSDFGKEYLLLKQILDEMKKRTQTS